MNDQQAMKTVVLQAGRLQLQSAALPQPGPGQVLLRSLACGICGSDLHILKHSGEVFALYRELGLMSAEQDDRTPLALGHEFCGEIVSYGPQTEKPLAVGSRVTSVPMLLSQQGAGIGVTPGLGGAYSEYFVIDEALMLAVPEQLPAEAAALTEPLAVGLHAVNRSAIGSDDIALVVGCGPIGLATLAALQRRGVQQIVAADLNSEKLQLAQQFGATAVVNPRQQDEIQYACATAPGKRLVIFECVGIHTLIDGFIRRAPAHSTLVVTGVHTTPSSVNYAYATVKELDLRFSYYYQPQEFAECLQALADGEIAWQKMLSAKVGIDGVPQAFAALQQPNDYIKVVIEPWRDGPLQPVSL